MLGLAPHTTLKVVVTKRLVNSSMLSSSSKLQKRGRVWLKALSWKGSDPYNNGSISSNLIASTNNSFRTFKRCHMRIFKYWYVVKSVNVKWHLLAIVQGMAGIVDGLFMMFSAGTVVCGFEVKVAFRRAMILCEQQKRDRLTQSKQTQI